MSDSGENTSGSSPPPSGSHVHHNHTSNNSSAAQTQLLHDNHITSGIKKAPLRRSSQQNKLLTGPTTQSIIHPNPHQQQHQHLHHHQQQPNLDERLRQYSAYELNRRPKTSKTGGGGCGGSSSKQSHSGGDSELSCCGEDSSGSFFLHDPSTLSYNRLSDLFPNSSPTSAQTVCSDDSGVGLTTSTSSPPSALQTTQSCTAAPTQTHNKPLSRPKSRPPKPPGIYTYNYILTNNSESFCWKK